MPTVVEIVAFASICFELSPPRSFQAPPHGGAAAGVDVTSPLGLHRNSDELRRNCDFCVKKKVGQSWKRSHNPTKGVAFSSIFPTAVVAFMYTCAKNTHVRAPTITLSECLPDRI